MKYKFKIGGLTVAFKLNEPHTKIAFRPHNKKPTALRKELTWQKCAKGLKCEVCGQVQHRPMDLHSYLFKDSYRFICEECEKKIVELYFEDHERENK